MLGYLGPSPDSVIRCGQKSQITEHSSEPKYPFLYCHHLYASTQMLSASSIRNTASLLFTFARAFQMHLIQRSIRCAPYLLTEEAEVSGLAPDGQHHVKYFFCIANILYVHVSYSDISVQIC